MNLDLSSRCKIIFKLLKDYSTTYKISTIGTEFLILAMYETEGSLCHFLLNEYEVTKEEIMEKINNIFILRKKKDEFNNSLKTIINQAKILSKDEIIKDEHLFMATLMNQNTIACSILKSLNLNIDELIKDTKEIYDFDNDKDDLLFVDNITKNIKDKGLTFIGRENYLCHMDVIINRKYKNNPLLIGNAGVGKTALVEGYAKKLISDKKEITILSLNLTSMLAGTRYRGDFEERFDKFIKDIATKKNVIIFIDEIHTIMGAATTEGNLDVANMLKPFLARSDIKLIGATTLDEYHKTIAKDKALSRRFQPIFVSEPTIDETRDIIFGLRNDYEKYHNVKITNDNLEYLILESDRKIKTKFRPDKCLDILDDCMSYNQIHNISDISIKDIDKAILGYSSNNKEFSSNIYPKINEYKWLYDVGLLENSPLLKLKYIGNNNGLNNLINEIVLSFNLGYEEILEIDLESYKDSFMLSSLIGSPPGYVGYEDEGILVKHILEYPMSLICFKGFVSAHPSIKTFIYSMLKRGSFVCQRGRLINLSQTIIIIEGIKDKHNIGFSKTNHNDDNIIFDDVIYDLDNCNINLNHKYINALKKLDYEISFDFDINESNKNKVNNYLYNFINNNEKGKYSVSLDLINNK